MIPLSNHLFFSLVNTFNFSMQIRIKEAKPIRIHADLDPVGLCRNKFEFLLKKYTKWVIGHKAYLQRYKSLSQISGLFVSFWSISCSWIRIRIPNTDLDPDPGMRIQCRSVQHSNDLYKTFKNPQHTYKKFSKTQSIFLDKDSVD
jgi:hypothetical protein